MKSSSLWLFSLALLSSSALVFGQTFVRVTDHETIERPSRETGPAEVEGVSTQLGAEICNSSVRASDGMPVPGGGSLDVFPARDPAAINNRSQVAFFTGIQGTPRNQGIFLADPGQLQPVAVGCGGGGGSGNPGTNCGDPSPLGGRFTGFFGGTSFAPDVNDGGDVLFLADVFGGTSNRALFLWRAATRQIVKVAAIGDPSPLGGTFGAVGTGSLNGAGAVAFLASAGSAPGAAVNVFLWQNGGVSTVARVGEVIPGSGTISGLGGEWFGFADGTFIPAGPTPDIDDTGRVAYRAIFSNGVRGLYVETGGVALAYVRNGAPTPIGGTYFDFFAPVLNTSGHIAFFAEVQLSAGVFNAGWFAGEPGNWRKVLVFHDPVDGGQALVLAVSRNPMQPFDDAGNVVLWCDLSSEGGDERLVKVRPDGVVSVIARQGDSTPAGPIVILQGWPSTAECAGLLSTNAAHMVFEEAESEVEGVAMMRVTPGGDIQMTWDTPHGICTSTRYDVTRGTLAELGDGFQGGAVCAAYDLDGPPYSESSGGCAVPSDEGCWYLARAVNDCGAATWGPSQLDELGLCP